ncbi:MAG TPA: hypothetical protein VMU50_03145, partial [Polyangia bacterium]|nr:hypothetical protein [Polyangia bacterium]
MPRSFVSARPAIATVVAGALLAGCGNASPTRSPAGAAGPDAPSASGGASGGTDAAGTPSGSGGGGGNGTGGATPITDAAAEMASPGGPDAAGGDVPSAGDAAASASAGCTKPAADPPGQWAFNKTIVVGGATRTYHLRLPAGYDPNKPYRTIFSFHGCGSHRDQLINIQDATGFDAIVIAPEQISGGCFDDQSAMSRDMAVFDALLIWAEDNLCVDKARVFSMGFSSGSWMTNILGCQRSNVLRAKANVSGGLTAAIVPSRDCKGPIASIFLHDASDTQNSIAGGMAARNTFLTLDGCAMTSKPDTMVPANAAGLCVQYDGCKPGYPVIWCQTTGINHDPQQTRSPNLFWQFL